MPTRNSPVCDVGRTDPFFTPVCSTPVASCSIERASVPSQCFLVGLLRVQIRPSLSRSFSSFKFAYQFIRAKGRLHSREHRPFLNNLFPTGGIVVGCRGVLNISFGIDRAGLSTEGLLSNQIKYLLFVKYFLIYSSFKQEFILWPTRVERTIGKANGLLGPNNMSAI